MLHKFEKWIKTPGDKDMAEIRGTWIANIPHSQVLSSRINIIQALDCLQVTGFNVVFPVVWNQGFTLFPSQVMQGYGFDSINSFFGKQGRDPLAELIEEAKKRKIAVIPWFEYGFASSPREDGGHILERKPHWAARKQDKTLLRHGNLTWMNALDLEVQQFMQDLILEVVRQYDVDGIGGDDRLPALPVEGGYDEVTKSRFRQEFGFLARLPSNPKNKKWIEWRAGILTKFLASLRSQVKAIKPELVISMAPAVFPFCLENLLQDSQAWVQKGLVDIIHPQIYRSTFEQYQTEIEVIKQHFSGYLDKFAPGIAFRANAVDISFAHLVKAIELNRRLGMQGEVFFFLEGLLKVHPKEQQTAAEVLQQGLYSQFAALPPPFVLA